MDILSEEICSSQSQTSQTRNSDADSSQAKVKPRRKKQFRWNAQHDLFVVTDVEAHIPFTKTGKSATEAWLEVARSFSVEFKVDVNNIAVSRRFELLITTFQKKESKNRYRSGIEEAVSAIKSKLQNLLPLWKGAMNAAKGTADAKKKRADSEKALADGIRMAALTTVKRKSDSPLTQTTNKVKVNDKTLVELWNKKEEAEKSKNTKELEQREKDRELQIRKIMLDEKKLELDQEKFNFQKEKEREEFELKKQQFDLSKEERQAQLRQQQLLIEALMKRAN